MADIFARGRISDDHPPIAVAIRYIHTIGRRIDGDVGGQIEQGRAVAAAILVVAVRPLSSWTADHHHKLAVLGELQDHPVGTVRRCPG